MYGIEDKFLAMFFSLSILVIYKSAKLLTKTAISPASIFSASWFIFTIFPLVLLFRVPINSLAILYIVAANFAFLMSAIPFNWQFSIERNANKKFSKFAFDSKFLSFIIFFSVAAAMALSFAVMIINGFTIDQIIFDPADTSRDYASVRGEGGLEYGLIGIFGILFTYLPPVLGGLRSLAKRRGFFFWLSMIPSMLSMIIQSQKLVFLVALCFYCSGAIVARIYCHKLDFPKPKSFLRFIAIAVILSALVLVSFVSRLGEFQFGEFESILGPLMYSIASYTLGQIYAFADFFSYTIGYPALINYKNDYYSFGQFTFNSIFSILGLGREFPPGMYDESSWYLNVFETNIFTFFRGLIYDFGVIGSLIFVFLFGIFANYVTFIVFVRNRSWLAVVALISLFVFIFMGYLFSVFVARYVFFTAAILWLLLLVNDRCITRGVFDKGNSSI